MLLPFTLMGQNSKFVNQTEIALLMGRSLKGSVSYYPYYSSYYPGYWPTPTYSKGNTGSFSIQTFNGWRVKPKTVFGLTTGVDAYQGALIMPLAAGIRQILFEKGPTQSKIQASLDAGIGTMWLDGNDNENMTKKGGIMLNPAIGFVFPTKSSSALLINFGYKYQRYSVSNFYAENNFSEESRNIKRFQIRLGFQF